ncbi:MAG: eCIS core domain-containing protein [Spirulinaceae cyanobacterium]
MSRQHQTRTAASRHTSKQKPRSKPQFAAPPVVQPKGRETKATPSPEAKSAQSNRVDPLARLQQTMAVQAQLTVGEPNDKYEQEADRVAKAVVQRIHTGRQPQTNPEDSVQRSPDALPQPVPISPLVQRQGPMTLNGGEAASELESSLNQAKGGGQSLEPGLQRSMGQAMGADFSGVKIHTDGQSDQLNHSLQARAFTTGQHVFFKKGEYNPGSKGGQELIAHELTHVVQQNGPGVSAKINRAPRELIQRNRLRFADEDDMFAEFVDVADTAAMHMGTGNAGPTFAMVSDAINGGAAPTQGSNVLLGSGSADVGTIDLGSVDPNSLVGPTSADLPAKDLGQIDVKVGHIGGALGAATNIFNTCLSIKHLVENIQHVRKANATIKAADSELNAGEKGLKTATSILEKEKGTAGFNIGEESVNFFSGLNGITNGVTTFWSAFSSAPEAVVAVSGGTFLAGAALGAVLGTVTAIRLFTQARRKAAQLKEIQSTIKVYEGQVGKCEGQIKESHDQIFSLKDQVNNNYNQRVNFVKEIEKLKDKKNQKIEAYEDFADEQRAAMQGALLNGSSDSSTGANMNKLTEALNAKFAELVEPVIEEIKVLDIKLSGITDPDPTLIKAAQENISRKGQQIPTLIEMIGALTTSAAQHERSKNAKIAEGTLSAVGALGAGALTVASMAGATAALATPIGWGIVGAVAIGALIYGIGKHVNKQIRKSNVQRMQQEQVPLELYIETGHIPNVGPIEGFNIEGDPIPTDPPNSEPLTSKDIRRCHIWWRKNFPTIVTKGWFNKMLSKSKSGRMNIEQRLEQIDLYLTKHAVTEDKGDVMYHGIVDALMTPQGNEPVTIEKDGTETEMTLKQAIKELLASKDISVSDVISDVESGNTDKVKSDIVKAMKLNEMI